MTIKCLRPAGASGNVLVTIAIGESVYASWANHACPSWLQYAKKYDLGVYVVISDLIEKTSPFWKKPTWQKMLLGAALREHDERIEKTCYLDTDFLISPMAENVFEYYLGDKIGLVSLFNGLPYARDEILKKVTALRQCFVDATYPSDSAIHLDLKQVYEYSGLEPQRDFACMGLILFNIKKHWSQMRDIFFLYPRDTRSITGGDQTHYNFEIFSKFDVEILDYSFQAIWQYELAHYYPFLMDPINCSPSVLQLCIESTLLRCNFLHFAGSWAEGSHWKECYPYAGDRWLLFQQKYSDLVRSTQTPSLYGRLKSPSN